MSEYSDQEIDLRPYVDALLDKWYWIAGAGVLFAALGFLISSLMAPTYEATALVAITEPRQRVQFDPRIQTVSDTQPLKAYPELALSDELLGEVIQELPGESGLALSELRGQLAAEAGTDASILKLTASNGDPVMAAALANQWAESFVAWANQVYGDQGDEQLLFFEAQLLDAADQLTAAERALIEFQARNRSAILENELLALQQTQADYLAKQRQTDLILQDIESLLDQDGGAADQAVVDQLAAQILQVRALGGVPNVVESTMPWQVQLNVDGQAPSSARDQQGIIANLKEVLLAQTEETEERLNNLEPQLLSVQQEKQEANAEENRLLRNATVAEETYTALARTVDEKRITSQDTTSGVKLASRTAVPEEPSGPSRLIAAIAAGFIGLILGTILVLGFSIRSNAKTADETPS